MDKSQLLKKLKSKILPMLISGSLLTTPIILNGCNNNSSNKESINNEQLATKSCDKSFVSSLYLMTLVNKEYNTIDYYIVTAGFSTSLFDPKIIVYNPFDYSYMESFDFNIKDGYEKKLDENNIKLYPLEDTITYLYGYKEEYTAEEVTDAYETKKDFIKSTQKIFK